MKSTYEKWLIMAAILLAVMATGWVYTHGFMLAYGYAESHLNIAKRITDSITPGLAQLGGIWLPLPHLLLVPFTKIDWLWRTGLAGALVSGTAYVVSGIYVYRILMLLTQNRIASVIGFLVFAANPNILYMQSTAMTELPLIGLFLMSTYYFLKFVREKDNVFLLVAAGFWGFCATLTRYDGWPLVAAEGMILFVRRLPWGKVILFATLAFSGIVAWLGWDGLILGDPLYFTNSPFSAKSQQEGWLARGQLLTYHNLFLSIMYYTVTIEENIGVIITITTILGLILYLMDPIINEKWDLLILLAVPFGFYTGTLFMGQSIILIPGLTPENFEWQLFNIRYGLPMLPAAAIMTGYLAARLEQLVEGNWFNIGNKIVPQKVEVRLRTQDAAGKILQGVVLAAVVFQLFLFVSHEQKVMVWEDGTRGLSSALRYHLDAQSWIKSNYSGGMVLLDDYARTVSVIGSGIPMKNVIYVGNKPYWDISMDQPEKFASWIVMQKNDDVWKNIYDRPETQARLYKYFQKAYTSPEVMIFKRNNEVK